MTIANPLVVTVNAVAKNLVRINQDSYGSEYLLKSSTEEFRMKIRHSKEAVSSSGLQFDRHNVELSQVIYATESAAEIRRTIYFVLRTSYNDDPTAVGYLGVALGDLMITQLFTDLTGWQS